MAKSDSSDKNVTRVKASSTPKTKKVKKVAGLEDAAIVTPTKSKKKDDPSKKQKVEKKTSNRRNPLAAFFGYFKGAWYELRQVRWPNRRATWSLTGAVLAFTAFFILMVMLLDAVFKFIFELILR